MQNQKIIPFKITGMDSLGQGVSKESERITFIPKTAIGDAGEAIVQNEKKGVAFATAKSFTEKSVLRINPVCPHFEKCPSCHFLHLDYEQELQFKLESLQRLFRKLVIPEIQVIDAPRRLQYRNRIQLHYHVADRKMGMLDARSQQIIPVPECLIGIEPVQKEMQRLYLNDQWLKEAPSVAGHLEIYWLNEKVSLSWDKPYAQGGFTQVFEEMNQVLKDLLHKWSFQNECSDLVDLFAGSGNLSDGLNFTQRLCIDYYTKNIKNESFSLDLYSSQALKTVKAELQKRSLSATQLLLDPPRSGMKELHLWLESLKPQHVAYVSCDPHTLARDIQSLTGYNPVEVYLIDFFPSTFHHETLIILERKS